MLLERRRDRSIATILSYKDSHCDQFLPEDISSDLRKVILDEVNSLCDYALRLTAKGDALNELFLDRMSDLLEE